MLVKITNIYPATILISEKPNQVRRKSDTCVMMIMGDKQFAAGYDMGFREGYLIGVQDGYARGFDDGTAQMAAEVSETR